VKIHHTSKLPGRIVETTDGREFLWFSGTDYLGMGHNEDLRRYLYAATETFGNHYGSSRNNSLRLEIYDETERQLADFLQSESALIVSSGMWAGQLLLKVIEEITNEHSTLTSYHYSPGVHPALWRNTFQRTDLNWHEWSEQTVARINEAPHESRHIICSDAVGSPMVKAFDFSVFDALKEPSKVWLLIDESHSLGVLGATGKGIAEQVPSSILPRTTFVSSLNKALGIPAGAIWGAKDVIAKVRQSPWYAGASPPAPAYMSALKTLLEQNKYETARTVMLENTAYFNRAVEGRALFESIPAYPVFCSSNAALFDYLLQNGILASCFPYPSPADASVTRIAISSLHQKEDLDRLAEVCKRFNA
jgi:8-amino-7-oxononanoate synthase